MVGAAAQRLFPEGRLIAHVTDLNAAVRETQEALATPGDITLFEPALRWADILVRADILERRGGTCRLIEVKSSTKVKDYHVTDAGIQTWVLRGAGLTVARTELAHINNQFVYPGGGDYRGLFTYVDVTDAILPLQEQIPEWIAAAQRDLAGPMPDIAVGAQCNDPFECEFMAFCAPDAAEYPVACCPTARKLARELRERRLCGPARRSRRPADAGRSPADLARDHQRRGRALARRRGEARRPPLAALLPRFRNGRAGGAAVAGHAPVPEDPDAVVVPPPGSRRHAHVTAALPRHAGRGSAPRVRRAPRRRHRRHRADHGLQRGVRAQRDPVSWPTPFPISRRRCARWPTGSSTCCPSSARITTIRR